MATFAIAAMAIGTGMSAYSQYKQGKEQEELHEQRAKVARLDAKAVIKASRHEAREKRKEGRRFRASQKALFAASGIRIAGTPLLVMKETADEFETEAALIQEGGMTEGRRLRSFARMERQMGASAYRAGKWGAGSTLLTGAGRMGMYGSQQGWFGGGGTSTPSSASGGTMAWSGYRRPRRRTTFRGL